MSAVQAVVVSPVKDPHTPPSVKRKITPSAVHSSSKRSLLLISPSDKFKTSPGSLVPLNDFHSPDRQVFSTGVAVVEPAPTRADPFKDDDDASTAVDKKPWAARHVLLQFDLANEKVDPLSKDILPLLQTIFPNTTSIGNGGNYLHFGVKELPEQPWPLTVGGLPITIADSHGTGRGPLFPLASHGNPRDPICQGFDAKKEKLTFASLRRLAAEVHDTFAKKCPNVRVIEVIFTTTKNFYIVIGDETPLKGSHSCNLPGQVANCWTSYINDKDMHRPSWTERKAKRTISPKPEQGIVDNTAYEILRPGVMIHSKMLKDHAHPATYATTSGVCVKNPAGDQFITAASHGIGMTEIVHQVLSDGSYREIGKAIHEIPFTDISIIQLQPNVQFTNEIFEDEAYVAPTLTRLYGEDSEDRIRLGDNVHLDSPFTGNLDGVVQMASIKIEIVPPNHVTEDNLRYVGYRWVYTGQVEGAGSGNTATRRLPDGVCGSAIWNDDGVVLGFFHYLVEKGPFQGFAASVDSSELVRMGYSLI